MRNLHWDGQIAIKETFSTEATKVKKLLLFFHFQYPNFEGTVTNFDKDMFRKESFCCTNSYSYMNITFNPIRPGLFSRSPGPGGLRGPDAKNQS